MMRANSDLRSDLFVLKCSNPFVNLLDDNLKAYILLQVTLISRCAVESFERKSGETALSGWREAQFTVPKRLGKRSEDR